MLNCCDSVTTISWPVLGPLVLKNFCPYPLADFPIKRHQRGVRPAGDRLPGRQDHLAHLCQQNVWSACGRQQGVPTLFLRQRRRSLGGRSRSFVHKNQNSKMIMHSCSQVEAWTYPEYTRHQTVLAGLPPSANLPQRGPPRRTSGQAAQLAGVSRVVFLLIARNGMCPPSIGTPMNSPPNSSQFARESD